MWYEILIYHSATLATILTLSLSITALLFHFTNFKISYHLIKSQPQKLPCHRSDFTYLIKSQPKINPPHRSVKLSNKKHTHIHLTRPEHTSKAHLLFSSGTFWSPLAAINSFAARTILAAINSFATRTIFSPALMITFA